MKINYVKIWRQIGDAFATPFEERTGRQKNMTIDGLCHALPFKMEFDFDQIRWSVDVYGYWLTTRHRSKYFRRENDRCRATFAYFMAELGNEGYEELIKAVTHE